MSSHATGSTEELVNTTTIFAQYNSAVTALADGGWIVTWQDNSSHDVYQQRYDADGGPVDDETLVNTTTSSAQYEPSVTALADGGWVVVWDSYGQDGSSDGLYQQRYGADGALVGSETLVNTYTTSSQSGASVTALADGGWVVAWKSADQDGDSYGIYQQRYDADGGLVGDETQVNTYTTLSQYQSSVAALADGGWLVIWASLGQDGSSDGIYQQRYDADGSLVGRETQVNTTTTDDQSAPSVTALADGGWVVTWASNAQDGDGYGIYQQRYDADGGLSGDETRVNTYTTEDQTSPSVTALADGGWVVTWQSSGQDGDGYGIYQQRYDADGNLVGGETQVNTTTTDAQSDPSVTALADGGWIVTWTSDNQDSSSTGVYQRHFAPDIVGGTGTDSLDGTNWDETLRGLAGNDTLNGGGGDDILIGGYGNDTYVVNSSGDQVQEFATQGTDAVLASITYTLASAVENLTLTGTADINGTGNALANILTGNAGKNTLHGGAGADTIYGGKGVDSLYGDAGADTFAFNTGDTSSKFSLADTIYDFTRVDGDKIDLRLIDANGAKGGDQAFAFIGAAGFHQKAGELHFTKTASYTLIEGDTNGDGKADFAIHLDASLVVKATDFML